MWPLRGDKLSIEANPLVGSVDERSSQQWQPLFRWRWVLLMSFMEWSSQQWQPLFRCRQQAQSRCRLARLVREVAAGGYAGIRSVGVVVAVANSRLELSQAWTPAAGSAVWGDVATSLQVRVLPNRHGHGYSLICFFPARLGPISLISCSSVQHEQTQSGHLRMEISNSRFGDCHGHRVAEMERS